MGLRGLPHPRPGKTLGLGLGYARDTGIPESQVYPLMRGHEMALAGPIVVINP